MEVQIRCPVLAPITTIINDMFVAYPNFFSSP